MYVKNNKSYIVLIVHLNTASPLVPPLNDDLYTIESSKDFEQAITFTIFFDDIFSRENRVDSYCVSSQSSSCPNDSCVSPSHNYSCDGLIAGGDYNFTVRAVNCGNQEGDETEQLSISPRGMCWSYVVRNHLHIKSLLIT